MVVETKSITYGYPYEFQISILALMVQDVSFVSKYLDVLRPEYFDKESLRTICRLILTHFEEMGNIPDKESISARIYELKSKGVAESVVTGLSEEWFTIVHKEIADSTFIESRVVKFGQRQALKAAMKQSLEILKTDDDVTKVQEVMEKAFVLGTSRDAGFDFREHIEKLPDLLKEHNVFSKVPTLLPTLDYKLNGGPGRGEVCIVAAPPKYGKSIIMTNIGANAVYQGEPVLYVSNELKQLDLLVRFAARFTGLTQDEVLKMNPRVLEHIKQDIIGKNKLRLKYFPPQSLSIEGLRAFIGYLGSVHKFRPSVLIIDYPDRMLLPKGETYEALGKLYDDIAKLSYDFKTVTWVASHLNRAQYRVDEASADGVTGSWLKFGNADLLILLCQNKAEKEKNEMRLSVIGARRGGDGYFIPCNIDPARVLLKEIPRQQYQAPASSAPKQQYEGSDVPERTVS